jgi:hypothetical protein
MGPKEFSEPPQPVLCRKLLLSQFLKMSVAASERDNRIDYPWGCSGVPFNLLLRGSATDLLTAANE